MKQLAIVGCGAIARAVMDELRQDPGLRVVRRGRQPRLVVAKAQPASLVDKQANPAAIPLDVQGVHDPWISSFIPSTRTISKALPNWQVGLPFSRSTMNRKPLPEAMAKSFWVTFKRRRSCRIASPKVLASSIVLIPDREDSRVESWNPSKSS